MHPAIHYARETSDNPKLVIHRADIDLLSQEILPVVTAPSSKLDTEYVFTAKSTTDFLQSTKSILAINGGFFDRTEIMDPWRYYPHRDDPVTPHGLVVRNGKRIELFKPGLPALCFAKKYSASIHRHGCPSGTWQGLAGAAELVRDGIIQVPPRADDPLAPQTAAALNTKGTHLTLYVVDGRQPGYSEGLTQYALAELMVKNKHTAAISFDGGGSSTMAGHDKFGARLLNVPINAGIPFRQRFVATHLGVQVKRR